MTREEAIGALEDVRDAICESIPGSHPELDELKEAVQMAVNALAERKKGKWINRRTIRHDGEFYCSRCEFELDTYMQGVFYNYCPNCGCSMKGDSNVDE